jgi:hypothetical protein
MVDCYDRLHLQLSELVQKPLRELRSEPSLSEVTVRPPGRGCRVYVTIRKSQTDNEVAYEWNAQEVDRLGEVISDGRTWSGSAPFETPESAYWSAVEVISASRRAAPR